MATRVQSLVAVFLYVRVFRNCSELKLFCSHYLLTQILGHPPKDPNTDRTLKPLFVWRAAEDLNSRASDPKEGAFKINYLFLSLSCEQWKTLYPYPEGGPLPEPPAYI